MKIIDTFCQAQLMHSVTAQQMKANALLKHNIDTLLRLRSLTRKDLAQWCRRSESWISKIFRSDKREMPMKYLDRISDMLGVATYQLLQPGIGPLTERRHSERRSGRERRIGHAQRHMVGLAVAIDSHRPGRKGRAHVVATSPLIEELNRLAKDYERRISALISQAELGRQTAGPGTIEPRSPRRRGSARGSDSPTSKDE